MNKNLFTAFQEPQIILDPLAAKTETDTFGKLTQKMNHGVNNFHQIPRYQIKQCSKHYKYECEKIASSLTELGVISCLPVWPDIISFPKSFLSKHKEYQNKRNEVNLSQVDLEGIRQHMDVILYGLLDEVSHLQK
ncbi:hypothetical protein HPB51_027686 [Rhipicephalus microplus]|uniref:Uncharacterized protein n=1 Tax=Rhipicephalus microplus TaxID=6941 RepID=A0A9J6CZG2_RHIMP|nr:hypothetical protein HPB51_027686 [Rhipicephalus microplus]